MPKFKYKALNLEGYMVRGQEEAENRQDLYAKLRNHQLFLVKAQEVITTQKERKPLLVISLQVSQQETAYVYLVKETLEQTVVKTETYT